MQRISRIANKPIDIFYMIRVFLKIFQLVLHIKEPVAIEINIKKQEKTITLPENFTLIDGRADINASF